MKKGLSRNSALALVIGTLIGGFSSAHAQDNESAEFTLDEIVITAERKETNAQDTPIAVTAFSGSVLDENNINGNIDLQMRLPSTTFTSNKITIRGIGREMNQIGLDPGVGVYVDGMYNSEQHDLADLFDVDRVEVLRGPAGTLYGKNTVGGAINIIMKRPTPVWEGQVKISAGNYQTRSFQGVISGPVYKDKLMARIVAEHMYWGGKVKNVWNDDMVGAGRNWDTDVRLLFRPTDKLEFYGTWGTGELYQDTGLAREPDPWKNTGVLYITPDTTIPSSYVQRDPNQINPGVDHPWTIYRNPDDFGKSFLTRTGMKGNTITTFNATDNLTFKHLQEYRDWEAHATTSWAVNTTPEGFQMFSEIPVSVYGWSQELQVFYATPDSPVSVIGGLYYYFLHEYSGYYLPTINLGISAAPVDAADARAALWGPFSGIIPYPVDYTPVFRGGYPAIWGFDAWNDTTSKAIYSQIEYQLTKQWNITLGLRYVIDEKKGYESTDQYYQVHPDLLRDVWDSLGLPHQELTDPTWYRPPQTDQWEYRFGMPQIYHVEAPRKKDFSEWIGNIGADYKPSDETLLFGKVSKGYKAGGFPLGTIQAEPVDSEILWAYEAGWKQLWADSRFNSNLAVYYYDYENLQVTRDLFDPTTGYSLPKIENAKGAELWGIELEAQGYILENLLATLTYSYIKSEYLDFVTIDTTFPYRGDPVTGEQQTAGNTLNRAPEHKFAISGTYTIPTHIGDFSLYAIYYWQDEAYYRPFEDEYSRAKPWDRTDARIMYHTPDYKWRVALEFNNIFNQPGIMDVTVDGLDDGVNDYSRRHWEIIDPFTWGLEVSYQF